MSRSASAFCITHTSASEHPIHLPPFPVWAAFPPSEYYGGSVPLRLSPVRESRVPCVVDVAVAVGALFVPLRSLETTLFPGECQIVVWLRPEALQESVGVRHPAEQHLDGQE